MRIIPTSSFTNDHVADATDYPALKMLWHADDITPSTAQYQYWTDRITGNILTINTGLVGNYLLKDSEGLYSTSAGSAYATTISGTMPTVLATHYAVLVAIGKTSTASTIGGPGFTLGADGTNLLSLASSGISRFNSAALSAAGTLAPTALTNNNKKAAIVTYYDFVDVTGAPVNPRIDRVIANDDFSSADPICFTSGATTTAGATLNGSVGQFGSGFTHSVLGTQPTARTKIQALFLFTNPLTTDELKVAAIEMARTGQLYAGWRNRL